MSAQGFTWPGRVRGNPGHGLIAAYLAIDIQKSPEWAKELLQKTDEVRSGQIESWERVGNGYCLRLFRDHAEIEENYEDQPAEAVKVSIDDFRAAAAAWLRFVEQQEKKT